MKSMPSIEDLVAFWRKIHFFASKGPAYHYAYIRWRLKNRLRNFWPQSYNVDDAVLLAAFNLEHPTLCEVKNALTQNNKQDALLRLAACLKARTSPSFFFNWPERQEIISLISVEQQIATLQVADEVCYNTFNFRGVGPITFKEHINWTYCPHSNIDWTWDLNRHAYFETLGRAYWYTNEQRYALKFKELLLDWLLNNPPGVNQSNWKSVFEVAFRINIWLSAFHYFRTAPDFDHETCLHFLKGLLAHGRYLNNNLERHVPNNHLFLEAKALILLGLLFPEFKEAAQWRRQGLKILYHQIQNQIRSDGIHAEQSTHYHRIITGELLELLVFMRNNNIPAPPDIGDAFEKLLEFELWIVKPNGLIPLLGDSALTDTYFRFSAARTGPAFLERYDLKAIAPPPDEASIWLLGPERVKRYQSALAIACQTYSRAFFDGGYFVMRAGRDVQAAYLLFDCGPFGYKPVSSHGHADALSFELYAYGQTWLVDPGVYSTSLGQDWRNFFRGSRAHNTIVVDNQDQSVLMGMRRVHRPAQATLHRWISEQYFDFVDGSHNGYRRLTEPITHRRQIFFVKPEYWVIIDQLTGQGKHSFDLYFHLMPGMEIRFNPENSSLTAKNDAGASLTIVPLPNPDLQAEVITGQTKPIQGWVSFFSGQKQPAPVLQYRLEASVPVRFCTLLYPYAAKETNRTVRLFSPKLTVNEQFSHKKDAPIALGIETDAHRDYLMLDEESSQSIKFFDGWETDAALFYARHRKVDGAPIKVIARGGQQSLFQGQVIIVE